MPQSHRNLMNPETRPAEAEPKTTKAPFPVPSCPRFDGGDLGFEGIGGVDGTL
jgi:hypothetical protein